jgi:hypothetical protein
MQKNSPRPRAADQRRSTRIESKMLIGVDQRESAADYVFQQSAKAASSFAAFLRN